ncbi:MAG: rRNA methyltransferase [Solibacillus sp.]
MWKLVNGRLVQTTDESRCRYKTRVSRAILEELKELAQTNHTHVGYLLENGYMNLLATGVITYDKKSRPKDRVEFRTTCDAELLEEVRLFAKRHQLNLNDVMEASVAYIEVEDVKDGDWRYRIEM